MSNKKIDRTLITALLGDLKEARSATQALRERGIKDDDITILSSGKIYPETEYREIDGVFLKDGEAQIAEGAEAGAALGGLGGFLLGLTTLAISGANPLLVVGGALLTSLTTATVGGTAGGIFGVLVDICVPENDARIYAEGIEAGGALVAVRPPAEQARLAVETLEEFEATQPTNSVD
jgi:hypothetical protein